MHADLAGALERINTSWKVFEHKDKPMTKDQVRKVLKYGLTSYLEVIEINSVNFADPFTRKIESTVYIHLKN